MINGKKLPINVIDWDLEFIDKNLPKDFYEKAKPTLKNLGKPFITGTSGETLRADYWFKNYFTNTK